jgi:hypothetical protein
MKRLFLIITSLLLLCTSPVMAATQGYGADALIGGTGAALDAIDGAQLVDGDKATVYLTGGPPLHYNLDASSGAGENSPFIISPDSNAGTKRWILINDDPIYPEWWGAVGDDATDDTSAIESAVAASSGRTVFLSAKTYKITDEITLIGNFKITGSGHTSIVKQYTADKGAFENDSGSRIYNLTVSDFSVKKAANITGGTAFDLTDVSDSHFININILADDVNEGFLIGFKLYTDTGNGSYRNRFFGCKVRTQVDANARGYDLTSASGETSNSHYISGGAIRADSGKGVLIAVNGAGVSTQNVVTGITFEGSTDTAVDINGDSSTSQGNMVSGCRFEGVTNGVVLQATSVGNIVIGNYYTSGLTVKVSDAGTRNMVIEPSGNGGSKIDISRGDIYLDNGSYQAWPSAVGYALKFGDSGEANPKFSIKTGGRVFWGPGGASAEDINFNRVSTKTLEIENGKLISKVRTFTDTDATPDVGDGHVFKTGNTSGATDLNDLDSGVEGQKITIIGADGGNTTVKHDNTKINMSGGVDFTLADGDTIELIFDGTDWCEISRSDNTP